MDLLVAYESDPAGSAMARHLARGLHKVGDIYCGRTYDIAILDTPVISADWLESKFQYDAYVFLSKHAAESGRLALTCHTTGNFGDEATLGGSARQVAVPYHSRQKAYMRELWGRRDDFAEFQVTLEATHHGPTGLRAPSMFVEVGTTPAQWSDAELCGRVADILHGTYSTTMPDSPLAICMGGSHYPAKFTDCVVRGGYALGTIMPQYALQHLDRSMMRHMMERNAGVVAVLLDWDCMGPHRDCILDIIREMPLEVVRL